MPTYLQRPSLVLQDGHTRVLSSGVMRKVDERRITRAELTILIAIGVIVLFAYLGSR